MALCRDHPTSNPATWGNSPDSPAWRTVIRTTERGDRWPQRTHPACVQSLALFPPGAWIPRAPLATTHVDQFPNSGFVSWPILTRLDRRFCRLEAGGFVSGRFSGSLPRFGMSKSDRRSPACSSQRHRKIHPFLSAKSPQKPNIAPVPWAILSSDGGGASEGLGESGIVGIRVVEASDIAPDRELALSPFSCSSFPASAA